MTKTKNDGALWYQCSECRILLENQIKFLDHRLSHNYKGRQLRNRIFNLNGLITTIEELKKLKPDAFVPKIIVLRHFKSTYNTYEQLIYQPKVQISKTDIELAKSKQIQLKEQKLKQQLESKLQAEKNTNPIPKDEDYRVSSDFENDEVEILFPHTLNTLKTLQNRWSKRTLHEQKRKNNRSFLCKFCQPYQEFTTQPKFVTHVRRRHIVHGVLPCPCCPYFRSFNEKSPIKSMNKHIINTHETIVQTDIKCKLCPDQIFVDFTAYQNHLRKFHCKSKFYYCPECSDEYKTKKMTDLRHHLTKHFTGGLCSCANTSSKTKNKDY